MSDRNDPIRENYYKPMETVETVSSLVFYASAVLSFSPVFIEHEKYPIVANITMVLFVLSVIIYAILGAISRLYLFPRAEEARRKEFLSSAMGVELIHERTTGYYNNDEKKTFQRLAMMLLEDSFFTMRILRAMALGIRCKTGLYFCIWLVFLISREPSLESLTLVTIAIFSEEIISRWLRFEWQRMKVEKIYQEIRSMLQLRPIESKCKAYTIDGLISYESAKAVGGILLSAKKFEQLNPVLTEEWERIKIGLVK